MHPEVLHPTRTPARARHSVPPEAAIRAPEAAIRAPEAAMRAPEGRASRLPADWIHDGGLRAFRGDAGYLGRSIAALKLYLSLVVTASGDPAPVVLSYERIAALSGLSDPLICAGKKALLDQGLVTICGERSGGPIAYRLTGLYPAAASASVLHAPQAPTRIAALHALTCRKAPNLAALKTYLLLSAGGRDPDGVASLDVDAAADLGGTSHVKIVAALAALQALGLADALAGPPRPAGPARVRLLPLR